MNSEQLQAALAQALAPPLGGIDLDLDLLAPSSVTSSVTSLPDEAALNEMLASAAAAQASGAQPQSRPLPQQQGRSLLQLADEVLQRAGLASGSVPGRLASSAEPAPAGRTADAALMATPSSVSGSVDSDHFSSMVAGILSDVNRGLQAMTWVGAGNTATTAAPQPLSLADLSAASGAAAARPQHAAASGSSGSAASSPLPDLSAIAPRTMQLLARGPGAAGQPPALQLPHGGSDSSSELSAFLARTAEGRLHAAAEPQAAAGAAGSADEEASAAAVHTAYSFAMQPRALSSPNASRVRRPPSSVGSLGDDDREDDGYGAGAAQGQQHAALPALAHGAAGAGAAQYTDEASPPSERLGSPGLDGGLHAEGSGSSEASLDSLSEALKWFPGGHALPGHSSSRRGSSSGMLLGRGDHASTSHAGPGMELAIEAGSRRASSAGGAAGPGAWSGGGFGSLTGMVTEVVGADGSAGSPASPRTQSADTTPNLSSAAASPEHASHTQPQRHAAGRAGGGGSSHDRSPSHTEQLHALLAEARRAANAQAGAGAGSSSGGMVGAGAGQAGSDAEGAQQQQQQHAAGGASPRLAALSAQRRSALPLQPLEIPELSSGSAAALGRLPHPVASSPSAAAAGRPGLQHERAGYHAGGGAGGGGGGNASAGPATPSRLHAEHEAVLHTLLSWTVADLFSPSSSAGSEDG